MKYIKYIILILAFISVLFYLVLQPRSPERLFAAHIMYSIPSSVTNLHGQEPGGTGLAGNFAVITFSISPQDCDLIIHQLNFKKETDPVVIKSIEKRIIQKVNFQSPTYYYKGEPGDLTTYTMIVNKSKTSVYYQYIKI